MKVGDLVKIKLQFSSTSANEVIGTILSVKPAQPHICQALQPGPVYEIKILQSDGKIWESWIDQRDYAEILI